MASKKNTSLPIASIISKILYLDGITVLVHVRISTNNRSVGETLLFIYFIYGSFRFTGRISRCFQNVDYLIHCSRVGLVVCDPDYLVLNLMLSLKVYYLKSVQIIIKVNSYLCLLLIYCVPGC